ncbi:MAG TPA: S9 family peptidase, partial [Thermomicrobiales bacterium]|nr:S9 family peptidase [Thermomicrobiales bacterium]
MNETSIEPQPLTPEQLATMTRVGEARIAPDGSAVAFVVDQASKEGEHEQSAIWLVPFDAASEAGARQFTTGIANDRAPRWSPDSQRIAFLSDRAERGKSSVYVMRAGGGEGVRVFDQQGEMSGLGWSPDGRFLAALFTEPETEDEKKRKEERDDRVLWDQEQKYQRLWVLDPEAKTAMCVSPEARQVRAYAWSPDAERLAICTTANARMDEIFAENQLAIVPREGGEPTTILIRQSVTLDLTWSSDARYLAFRSFAGQVVHGEHVYRIDASGGEQVCLTEGYGGTVEALSSPDAGETLVLSCAEGVDFAAYRLSWEGEQTPLLPRHEGWSDAPVSVSRDGNRLALVWQTGVEPENIHVAEVVDGRVGELRRLTGFDSDLTKAALGSVSSIRWTSDAGVEVEGLLILPHGYVEGRRYPTVALVHGGPTWAWSRWFHANSHDWGQRLAARSSGALLPDPRGSTGRAT